MGRNEKPLDPAAGPVQRFAHELRRLRQEAGSPTYRAMGLSAGYAAPTLSAAAAGERLPTLPVTLAYVTACGGDTAAWEQRWYDTGARMAEAAELDDTPSPYRGLTRFDTDDQELFFGRDQQVDDLLRLVADHRFAAVIGASGSGKSSLLRAGLVPALRAGTSPGHRPAAVRIVTPGPHPARVHGGLLAPAPGRGDTVVLVDQFEEVFTLCQDPFEREDFLQRLLAAREPASRLRVVIAVRADFYGHCTEHHRLVDALNDANLLVGPMAAEQLREAIVKPAARAGLIVERALTARIIADVTGQPGSLPLMSHALLELWRRRRARTLTLAAYEAIGAVQGAIAHTGDTLLGQLTPAQADVARAVLLRLIQPGPGSQDTRRPTPRDELPATGEATTVLETLIRARLLAVDGDTVDLAHEALITSWPRLGSWIAADRDRLRLHRRLTQAAQDWEELDRDPGALYRGARLHAARAAFQHDTDLTPRERAFLTAGIRERRWFLLRAPLRTLRRLWRHRWGSPLIVTFVNVAIVWPVWSLSRTHT